MNTETSSTILSTLLNPTSLLHPLPISCVNLMIVQVKVKLVVIYYITFMYIVHSDTIVLALVVIKILPFLHSLVMITSVSPVIQVPASVGNQHYIQQIHYGMVKAVVLLSKLAVHLSLVYRGFTRLLSLLLLITLS